MEWCETCKKLKYMHQLTPNTHMDTPFIHITPTYKGGDYNLLKELGQLKIFDNALRIQSILRANNAFYYEKIFK